MAASRTFVLAIVLVAACGEKDAKKKAPSTLPAVSAIEPNTGSAGTKVKLFGARLLGSDGKAGMIRFGDVETAPTLTEDKVYYSRVPADVTEGTHEVVVTTIDGSSAAVTFAVIGPTPEEIEERAWAECLPRYCTGDTAPNARFSACDAQGSRVEVKVSLRDLLWDTDLTFAHIVVADPSTGAPTGICAVSDTYGNATLLVPPATTLAFRVVAVNGPPVNTFHQRFSANASRIYYGLQETSMDTVIGFGINAQPGLAVIFGVVFDAPNEPYFTWDSYNFLQSTASQGYGATTVAADPASGTPIYTDASGYWSASKTQIHPSVGEFIIYDVNPGAFKLAYFEDGVRVAVDYDTYRAFADELTLTFPRKPAP